MCACAQTCVWVTRGVRWALLTTLQPKCPRMSIRLAQQVAGGERALPAPAPRPGTAACGLGALQLLAPCLGKRSLIS